MELTINEVAEQLNLPVETVYRWVRQGKIPMQQSRGEYKIRAEMLERWANEHKLNVNRVHSPAEAACEPEFDSLLAAIRRGGVFYDVAGDNKEIVLRSVVEHIPNLDAADCDLIYERLLERERLASTGIGHGIALPHPRVASGVNIGQPQITICFLPQPVPFDAIDHRPVSVLIVLLSCSTKQHLSMLSKLAYHLREKTFRDFMLSAPPQMEIFETVEKLEPTSPSETRGSDFRP